MKDIMQNHNWYTLYIPSDELIPNDYNKIKLWQELSITLLKSFVDKLYNYEKSDFYKDKLETMILDSSHPSFINEYNFQVKKDEERIIEKLKGLREKVRTKDFTENFEINRNFEALYSAIHLYQPLIYIEGNQYKEVVKVHPVALNKGERDFVEDLKMYFDETPDFFEGKQLYLLRNLSRKGIGFFEANGNFYPDFILWLVIDEKQYISFIDPKGLRQIQGFEDPKIQLHKTIKTTIQAGVGDPDIELNSFIISNTSYYELTYWKGQESISDFNSNHVLFQKEQKNDYISVLMRKSINEF